MTIAIPNTHIEPKDELLAQYRSLTAGTRMEIDAINRKFQQELKTRKLAGISTQQ